MAKPPQDYETLDYWLFHLGGKDWMERSISRGLLVAALAYLGVLGVLLRRIWRD